MRYSSAGVAQAGDWTIFEVVRNGRCLCTSEFEDADINDLYSIYEKLRILQAAGFPPDREKGALKTQLVGRHKCGALGRVSVHALKVKPGPWRLYFFVSRPTDHEIDLLWAVAKKTDKRDPEDFQRCCRTLNDIANGNTTRERIILPNR